MQLHTYLNYGGNCEDAFKFYEKHLGGTITMMMRHGEQPDGHDVPPDWARGCDLSRRRSPRSCCRSGVNRCWPILRRSCEEPESRTRYL